MVKIDGSVVPVVFDSGATFNLLSYNAATKLHSDCDGVPFPNWAKSQPYSVADMDRDAGSPTISGYINGIETRVEFDTGASTSILDIRAAARAGVTAQSAGAVPGRDVYGVGPSYVKTWVVPVARVKIGEEETRNTRLRIGDISTSGADMLLGADFFLSHHVYFSNSQHKIYFTYNATLGVQSLTSRERQCSASVSRRHAASCHRPKSRSSSGLPACRTRARSSSRSSSKLRRNRPRSFTSRAMSSRRVPGA